MCTKFLSRSFKSNCRYLSQIFNYSFNCSLLAEFVYKQAEIYDTSFGGILLCDNILPYYTYRVHTLLFKLKIYLKKKTF